MKKVIIHIGFPKTATTTIQDDIFYQLYKQNKIGYLGKTIKKTTRYDRYYPVQDLLRPIFDSSDEAFEEEKILIKQKLESIVDKIEHDQVILSEEILSETRYKVRKIRDSIQTAKRLNFLFSKYNVEIVMLLRNQLDIVHSLYVESYKEYEQFTETDTFNKYLNHSIKLYPKSELIMYDYNNIIKEYISLFGKKNVHIFLFEDLKNEFNTFCKNFSVLFNIEEDLIKNAFSQKHSNKKVKRDDGVYTNEVKVVRRIGEKVFFSSIFNDSKLSNWIYELFSKNKIFKKIVSSTILQLLRYKKVLSLTFIKYPNEEEKEKINTLYKKSNKELSKLMNLNLKDYGYPYD